MGEFLVPAILTNGDQIVYTIAMGLEFDAEKDAANRAKHGVSLADAVKLEVLAVLEDDRFDYGEPRYRAWGVIDGVYFALAFMVRGEKIRPISLRRAHAKEIKRYVADQEESGPR